MGLFDALADVVVGTVETAVGVVETGVGVVVSPFDDGDTLDDGIERIESGATRIIDVDPFD